MSAKIVANALYVHLYDAIVLNRKRYPMYIARTDGKSRLVSWSLMAYEWLGLPVAKMIDKRAAVFHQHGIGVISDDLIDMKETPAFGSHDKLIQSKTHLRLDYKSLQKTIKKALKEKDFHKIVSASDALIQHIDANNGTNALLKHFVESIRRSAALVTIYRDMIQDEAIWNKLIKLETQYILMQMRSLGFTNWVDKRAIACHQMGVAIISQDVPHIPLPQGYKAP